MARVADDEAWAHLLRRPRRDAGASPTTWRQRLHQAARPRRAPRGAGVTVADPGMRAQRVIVRVEQRTWGNAGRYHSLKGWLHDHLDYLERDGTTPDGTPGQLYGRSGVIDTEALLDRATRDPRHFDVIVSAEHGHALDLTAYTRALMRQVEQDTGRHLDWAAANHYDTDHPHTHILIRGRDLDGEGVWMDRQYLHEGLRFRAQEIATRALGWRWEQTPAQSRDHGKAPGRNRDDGMDIEV